MEELDSLDPDSKSQSFPLLPLIAHKYEALPLVFFKELLSSTMFSGLTDLSNTGSTSLLAAVISIV
jgi:hypothetical protein